mgnify:CR=1 FL=1
MTENKSHQQCQNVSCSSLSKSSSSSSSSHLRMQAEAFSAEKVSFSVHDFTPHCLVVQYWMLVTVVAEGFLYIYSHYSLIFMILLHRYYPTFAYRIAIGD